MWEPQGWRRLCSCPWAGATVIPAEGKGRTPVSAMADTEIQGGGHQCPPDKKGYVPIGVRGQRQQPTAASIPGGGRGWQGGWDHCFDFGRGFNGAVTGARVPPTGYVVGSGLPSLGSEDDTWSRARAWPTQKSAPRHQGGGRGRITRADQAGAWLARLSRTGEAPGSRRADQPRHAPGLLGT